LLPGMPATVVSAAANAAPLPPKPTRAVHTRPDFVNSHPATAGLTHLAACAHAHACTHALAFTCTTTTLARCARARATIMMATALPPFWPLDAQRPSSTFPVQPPSENLTIDAEESHTAVVNQPCVTNRRIRCRGRRRRSQRQQALGHHECAARARSTDKHLRPPPPTVPARLMRRITSMLPSVVKAADKARETIARVMMYLTRIAHSAFLPPHIPHRHRRKRHPHRLCSHASSTGQASRRRRRRRQRSARRSRRRTPARPPESSNPGSLLQQLLVRAANAAATTMITRRTWSIPLQFP
jgi:hypothetical protein